jgi:ribosomal RNA-processing protein 12
VRASAHALKDAFGVCVDKETVAYDSSLQAIVTSLLSALTPTYASSHQYVLEAIAVLALGMTGAGPAALRLLSPVIKGLDELQVRGVEGRQVETAQSAAWRALIRALGPRDVLALVPLNLSQASTGRARPWLIAEVREGTRYAPLAYFFDDILPLAQELEKRAQTAQEQVSITLLSCAVCSLSCQSLRPASADAMESLSRATCRRLQR